MLVVFEVEHLWWDTQARQLQVEALVVEEMVVEIARLVSVDV